MKVIYNIGILLFSAIAYLLSPFNSRASLWVKGRKNWAEKIADKIKTGDRVIWIHCASLGEFEQGRPVIEAIKKELPAFKIMLTFFSPSGYEIRKNYNNADCISYLPSDTPGNAGKFIDLVSPEFVIFVKYEFWNNYISALYRNRIPLYLISGIFRPGQHFFKWYGSFFRSMLRKFEKIFVQDQQSHDLLTGIGIEKVSLAGDTRFDRVIQIAGTARVIPQIEQFRGTEKLFLAGSSWKQDEEIFAEYINSFPSRMKWVFAPHEIDKSNIERLEKLIKVKSVRFSEYSEISADARVLIIDNIGMLSSAYRYAYIAAVGGGFGKGIHNILEPACWGIPVIFGPKHKNFKEAVDLLSTGGARSFLTFDDFRRNLDLWLSDEKIYTISAETASKYVKENAGATGIIIKEISNNDINKACS
ncbi:MAG: glycosyltransferase N-terminal domain-containing protein [Bacteroidales bacterium]|jgi:3-deoxy-D-manno-octulosonic-acid transferase